MNMVEETGFSGIVNFLGKIGVYEVILPFLLVFTIVFAILEKTKVLGIEKVGDKEFTKKNLNSMVALSVALLVVASAQLVAQINEIMANAVLLIVLGLSFLLLIGVFFDDKQFSMEKFPGWMQFFMFFMFAGIVIIFLNAMEWLDIVFFLFQNWNADWAATIIFVAIIIGFIYFITKDPKSSGNKKDDKKE
jgi:hypothetical protein